MLDKKAILWGVIVGLLLVLVYVTFFQDTVASTNLGATAGQAASKYSGMVGGC